MNNKSIPVAVVILSTVGLSGCSWEWLKELWGKHHGGGGAACAIDQYEATDGTCVRKALSVSTSTGHTCAELEGGELKCWGNDRSWYVLGYAPESGNRGDDPGEMGDALPAIDLGPGLSVLSYDAGSGTCAAFVEGGYKCWGYNGYGVVLGSPGPDTVSDPVAMLPLHDFGGGRVALQVLNDPDRLTAVLDDGTLVGAGVGGLYDQTLGTGRFAVAFDQSPSYDDDHLCVLLDDGNVVCDGVGESGQLGRDPAGDPLVVPPEGRPLVDLGSGPLADAVVTGDRHTCVLLQDGAVKCWGDNFYGQLGVGDTLDRGLSPADMGDALVAVPLGQAAVALTAAHYHTCALLEDGSVKCWGRNDDGRLGIGSTEHIGDDPGEVAAVSPVDLGTDQTAVAVDADRHTCVVLDDGAIKCWGSNTWGQLGLGDVLSRGALPGDMGDALPTVDVGS